MSGRKTVSLFERFYKKVDLKHGDECWEWTGALNNKGYAKFGIYRDGKWKNSFASRVAWFISTGEWPVDNICHTCDNPKCVRYSHLFQGTQSQNIYDCVAKGRFRPHNAAKTHCLRGHPLSGDNLYEYDNRRHCRTCKREWKQRRRNEH